MSRSYGTGIAVPIVGRAVVLLALGLWSAVPVRAAYAQQRGLVIGTVVAEETGAPLADVQVAVEGTGRGTSTDARGRFSIGDLPVGSYALVAEYLGRSAARQSVVIRPGVMARVELRLPIEALAVDEIVVSVTGEARRKAETPASIGVVAGEEIRETVPGHPSEIMNRIPGVWVNVTGGEGHMAAIRQPMTTNPVYLYLEDGVPTRSTGFFNHNALYEINVPQADRIEVVKGPATALYGSDAIGGVVNVGTRAPSDAPALDASLEGGAYGWARVMLSGSDTWGADGVRADLNLTRTDGWRDGTNYDRQSATVRWDRQLTGGSRLKTIAAFSNIDQNTAGSSAISRDDYENRPTANYTPISYRKVRAFRLSSAYQRVSDRSMLTLTPYARWNSMDILPNWSLSYDPGVWETGHSSLGFLASYRRDVDALRARIIAGVDVDWSPGSHFERTIAPVREGAVYTSYTPGDVVYDYDVTFRGTSPYLHVEASPTQRLLLTAGLRYDHVGYAYDNPLGVATTGSYRRPASTTVTYDHLSPKLGATLALGRGLSLFTAYGHGFRAPSEGQLFRQGRAENTVGLMPVKADNIEFGVRGGTGSRVSFEASAYNMTKTDDILTYTYPDGSRETVNAGETRHRGVELALGVALVESLRLDASWSFARHSYVEWQPAATADLSGNVMETAPRQIGNVLLSLAPARLDGATMSLEWAHLGRYWMDPENTHEYAGHDLLNLRAHYPITHRLTAFARVMNLTDARYAERASYTAFRGEEFAPGLPRTLYAGIRLH